MTQFIDFIVIFSKKDADKERKEQVKRKTIWTRVFDFYFRCMKSIEIRIFVWFLFSHIWLSAEMYTVNLLIQFLNLIIQMNF